MDNQHPIDEATDLPTARAADNDDAPKFGRLLIVLLFVVMLIAAITFASEAYYS